MTPIKRIVRDGTRVFTEDWADLREHVADCPDERKAEWVAWSLGRAHKVEVFTEPPRYSNV